MKRPLMMIAVLVALSISLGCILVNESSSDSEGLSIHSPTDPFTAEVLNKPGDVFVVDDIVYVVMGSQSVFVKGCEGIGMASIVIPSTVTSPDGVEHTVSRIGVNAFKEESLLTSIVIPDTVTKIEDSAFEGCKKLKVISIPIDVEYDNRAFAKVKVESLTLTKGQTGVAKKGFRGLWMNEVVELVVDKGIHEFNISFDDSERLRTVSLLEVESIGEGQFMGCKELVSFSAPCAITVGDNAFMDCTQLRSVNLDSVESIGKGIFMNCHNMSVLSSGSLFLHQMNVYMILDGSSVSLVQYLGTGTESIVVPTNILSPSGRSYSVIIIGEGAFKDNKDIVRLTIPDSVIRVGKHAFQNCTSLNALTMPICAGCSYNTDGFAFDGVIIKDLALTRGYSGAIHERFWEPWKDGIVTLFVGEGIKKFDTSFKYAKELVSAQLLEVTSIGEDQFRDCGNLLSFSAPCAIAVGDNAFMDCTELRSLNLDSVRSIARGIMVNCHNLTSLSSEALFLHQMRVYMIHDGSSVSLVQYLGKGTDTFVVSTNVLSPSGKLYPVTAVGKEAFRGNNDIKELVIPDSVVKVDEHAFLDCGYLRTITVPIGIDCFYNSGRFAFEGVVPFSLTLTKGGYDPKTYMDNEFWRPFIPSLEVLVVDVGITEFETSFEGENLRLLTMYSVERVHERQFDSCKQLHAVSIPSAIVLEFLAFGHCKDLLSVEIQKVKVIADKAFLKCKHLLNVTSESVEVIGKEAFRVCMGLHTFNFSNVKNIGYKAFFDTCVEENSLPKDRNVTLGKKSFGNGIGYAVFDFVATLFSTMGSFFICLFFTGSSTAATGAAIAYEAASVISSFSTAAGSVASAATVGAMEAAATGFCATLSTIAPYLVMGILITFAIICLSKFVIYLANNI